MLGHAPTIGPRTPGLVDATVGLSWPMDPSDGPWAILATFNLLSYLYLLHLDSVWTDLDLIEFYFSSRSSLCSQYRSNLETANPNTLNLTVYNTLSVKQTVLVPYARYVLYNFYKSELAWFPHFISLRLHLLVE